MQRGQLEGLEAEGGRCFLEELPSLGIPAGGWGDAGQCSPTRGASGAGILKPGSKTPLGTLGMCMTETPA